LNRMDKINFFNHSFEEYDYKPSKIAEFYESCFVDNRLNIQSAETVKRVLDGYAAGKKLKVNKLDILLAYGGGKDSTMVLVFLRYVQELFLRDSVTPFKLHILIHVHPGMREDVLRNIHNIFRKLELNDDKNVKIIFESKGSVLDAKRFINEDFNPSLVSIPEEIKRRFRRELLLLGHMTRGLGRHTFCYTCNIDMVMSIINYTVGERGEIDLIVTGDSKKELSDYTRWLNTISSSGEKGAADTKRAANTVRSFFRDFIKLKTLFKNYLGVDDAVNDTVRGIQRYPELFNIHDYVNFSLDNFGGLLENYLGFSFNGQSVNFSETDCLYPAVMAYLAYERGGVEKGAAYLEQHIAHVIGLMVEKGFPDHFVQKEKDLFETGVKADKLANIKQFFSSEFGIDDKKLKALVYSPFLNNAERLQAFLDEHGKKLNSGPVIDYINGVKSFSEEDERKIEAFINDYIGLDRKDVKKIMNYSETPGDDDLLELIASGDPYVRKNVDIGNGEKITVSAR